VQKAAAVILITFISIILTAYPVYAIPSLIPVIPIIGAVIIKASAISGSIIFFVLSIIKKKKKAFTVSGIVLFIFSLFLMIYLY